MVGECWSIRSNFTSEPFRNVHSNQHHSDSRWRRAEGHRHAVEHSANSTPVRSHELHLTGAVTNKWQLGWSAEFLRRDRFLPVRRSGESNAFSNGQRAGRSRQSVPKQTSSCHWNVVNRESRPISRAGQHVLCIQYVVFRRESAGRTDSAEHDIPLGHCRFPRRWAA